MNTYFRALKNAMQKHPQRGIFWDLAMMRMRTAHELAPYPGRDIAGDMVRKHMGIAELKKRAACGL